MYSKMLVLLRKMICHLVLYSNSAPLGLKSLVGFITDNSLVKYTGAIPFKHLNVSKSILNLIICLIGNQLPSQGSELR